VSGVPGAVASLQPPASDARGDLGWVAAGPWLELTLLFGVAMLVMFVSSRALARRARASAADRRRGDFDLSVAKMEALPVVRIADAAAGPVRLEAVLRSASGAMGGAPERACVWHNRAGAVRSAAVAAELVVAGDESGQVALANLEQARVLAPKDPRRGKHEFVSLRLGDHVELLGVFTPERHGEDEDPSRRIYGVLGLDSQLQVRVLRRPELEAPPAAEEPATLPPSEPES
jgi:hypothetical protein